MKEVEYHADTTPFVLVLGSENCAHVQAVCSAVSRRGVRVVVLDTTRFPGEIRISYDPEGDIEFVIAGDRFRMSACRSVYWRNYPGVDPRLTGSVEVDEISTRDSRSLLESLLYKEGPRWFNGYHAWAMHKLKPVQMRAVAGLGVPVPETLMTNDVAGALHFHRRIENGIHKPVFGGSEAQMIEPYLMDAERLGRVFSFSPVTLQRCIEGTNLRTFVVGGKVFSVEILAKTLDFRLDPTHQIRQRETPDQVAHWSRQICRELAMRWTAIDWRVDSEGKHYFLEANPSPMFVGLSRTTDLDVAALLADELVVAESGRPVGRDIHTETPLQGGNDETCVRYR